MDIKPIEPQGTAIERWFITHASNLLNPRMMMWLVLTIIVGLLLYFVFGRAEAIGSMAVTIFNASALGYLGYRVSGALERGKRPHEIWEEARGAHVSDDHERGWQLEQLADSMQRRRSNLVAACIVAAVIMKF